ncbi:MAG: YraN family protein [Rickettsiales bacterium]|nr:YraN family protein [Pseudomonadota bacterium]MDA0965370.1 YraN family protein [Pseudomonadota bacterium]MDG4544298.1 YraN family protein [Rickettsiales bacterium]MDG4544857.1 YraN family protein [Rickettsiales bacterium]MDG4546979.1 YraN family protein [Rickettsiales bacterium]
MNKTKSYKFGLLAETIAVIYLRLCFYSIISRRHKTKLGEVDIIARRGNNLVFIEVKARKKKDDAYIAFTKHQQNRITRAAQLFIAKNPRYLQTNIRFDLILVCPIFFIKHIRNAWGY